MKKFLLPLFIILAIIVLIFLFLPTSDKQLVYSEQQDIVYRVPEEIDEYFEEQVEGAGIATFLDAEVGILTVTIAYDSPEIDLTPEEFMQLRIDTGLAAFDDQSEVLNLNRTIDGYAFNCFEGIQEGVPSSFCIGQVADDGIALLIQAGKGESLSRMMASIDFDPSPGDISRALPMPSGSILDLVP